MQQSRRPAQVRGSGISAVLRSRLMIIVLVVAVILVGVLIFRATRANSTAKPPATNRNHTTIASAQAGKHTAAKHPAVPKAKPTLTVHQIQVQTMRTDRKHYAASIVPTLDRSARMFDQAAGAAASASANFDSLQQSCTYWGTKIDAASIQYEGIPHPYVWWSPAGTLHHQTSGIYHYMLGAIQNCQEAVQATDSDAAATAVSQMASGAHSMHNQENYTRYLATH
ncbi:MAG TPA: hypothetical protein VF221_05295 [Chloroflexota bacterium]